MLPLSRPVLVAAVLAVLTLGACGDDRGDPVPPLAPPVVESGGVAPVIPEIENPERLDEETLLEIVHGVAATAAPEILRGFELPPRVSRARVAVAALHEHLGGRRTPAADDAQMFAALRALAALPGGAEASVDVPRMVELWSKWSPEERAAESELGQVGWLATTALSSTEPPGAEGLRMLAERGGAVTAPPHSPAAGVVPLLHLAASTLEREEGTFSKEHDARLTESAGLFAQAGWPAGGAPFLAHLAAHLVRRSETDLRSIRVFEAALSSYIQHGDPLRAGLFLVDRAQAVTRETDPRRALSIVERGKMLVEESGALGVERFHVLDVHAGLLQTVGRHADAVTSATAALSRVDQDNIHVLDAAAVRGVRAVSLFRLGLYERAYTDAGAVAESLSGSAPEGLRAHVMETAAQAAYELGRYDRASELYREAASVHGRKADTDRTHRWQRDADLVRAAGALSKAGCGTQAAKEVRALLAAASQPPAVLALSAAALIDAADLDGAAQVVEQAEASLGRARRDALGEVAGRLFAARGEFPAARERFSAALSYATQGRRGAQGPTAASILVSWADAEEADDYPLRALRLRERAAAHLAGGGSPGLSDQIRVEIIRLARLLNERGTAQHCAVLRVAQAHFENEDALIDAHIDRFLTTSDMYFAGIERVPDPSGVMPPSYREVALEQVGEFPVEDARALLKSYSEGSGRMPALKYDSPRLGALDHLVRAGEIETALQPDKDVNDWAGIADEFGAVDPEMRRRAVEFGIRRALTHRDAAAARTLLPLADAYAGQSPRETQMYTSTLERAVLVAPLVVGQSELVVRLDADGPTVEQAAGLGDALNLLLAAALRGTRADVEQAAGALGAAFPAGTLDVAEGESLVLLVDEPYLRAPWDLVPVNGRLLLERAPLSVVTCAAEWIDRHELPATEGPPPFEERYVPRARSALVPVRGGAQATDALAAAFEREFAKDKDAAAALRRAKLELRAADTSREGAVPAWASLLLRGPAR